MVAQNPGITFEEATESDIPELTVAMTKAFDDDSQKHLGKDRGGPDGALRLAAGGLPECFPKSEERLAECSRV